MHLIPSRHNVPCMVDPGIGYEPMFCHVISSGASLRDSLALADEFGCTIRKLRRTGEVLVSHPAFVRPLRINGRRKDAPRCLTVMLRKLAVTHDPF